MGGGNSQTPQAEIPGILDTSGKALVPATSELPYGVTLTNENGKIAYKLVVGAKMQFKVNDDGSKSESISYTWGSTDPSVATIDVDGFLTAIREGITTIYALYDVTEGDKIIQYYIPIIIKVITESGNGIPGDLQFDPSMKYIDLSYYTDDALYGYPLVSPADYNKYAANTVPISSNSSSGFAVCGVMIPGSKARLSLMQHYNPTGIAEDWDSVDITDHCSDIIFKSSNPNIIEIKHEIDATFSPEPQFYAVAKKPGKAIIHAEYEGKYVYIDVDVTGFNIALDRAKLNSLGELYRIYESEYELSLIYNGFWYSPNEVISVYNDTIYQPRFNLYLNESSTNNSKHIIPLKVVTVPGNTIGTVTWTQTPIAINGYPAINDLVTITTSDNGKTLQIAPKNNTARGFTTIKGTANGTTHSFFVRVMFKDYD